MKRSMKSLISLVLCISIVSLMVIVNPCIVVAADPYFSGSGTEADPFQISNANQLAELATLVNAGETPYNVANYVLINDIDLSGNANWTPIGSNLTNSFSGVFVDAEI